MFIYNFNNYVSFSVLSTNLFIFFTTKAQLLGLNSKTEWIPALLKYLTWVILFAALEYDQGLEWQLFSFWL